MNTKKTRQVNICYPENIINTAKIKAEQNGTKYTQELVKFAQKGIDTEIGVPKKSERCNAEKLVKEVVKQISELQEKDHSSMIIDSKIIVKEINDNLQKFMRDEVLNREANNALVQTQNDKYYSRIHRLEMDADEKINELLDIYKRGYEPIKKIKRDAQLNQLFLGVIIGFILCFVFTYFAVKM